MEKRIQKNIIQRSGSELRLRGICPYYVAKLEELARNQGMSKDKFCSMILKKFVDNEINLDSHKEFFKNETESIISTINQNDKTINLAISILERIERNGNQSQTD